MHGSQDNGEDAPEFIWDGWFRVWFRMDMGVWCVQNQV